MVVANTAIDLEIKQEDKRRALNTLLELWHCQYSEQKYAEKKRHVNQLSFEDIQNELIENNYEYDFKIGEWLPF